jgi:Ca2+:H+ antiporter
MSSLVMVVTISLLIPTTMFAFPPKEGDSPSDVYHVSHTTAITLFLLLLIFFYFQLKTHHSLFRFTPNGTSPETSDQANGAAHVQRFTLTPWAASGTLIVATLCVIACATFLVGSVDKLVEKTGMSQAFVGLFLIPLFGNATKYATIVTVARKSQIDLAIRAIIGSVLRITLLITPMLLLFARILDQPMTLQFDVFEGTMFFLAIMVMNYLIHDGESNYFEGLMLVGT